MHSRLQVLESVENHGYLCLLPTQLSRFSLYQASNSKLAIAAVVGVDEFSATNGLGKSCLQNFKESTVIGYSLLRGL